MNRDANTVPLTNIAAQFSKIKGIFQSQDNFNYYSRVNRDTNTVPLTNIAAFFFLQSKGFFSHKIKFNYYSRVNRVNNSHSPILQHNYFF